MKTHSPIDVLLQEEAIHPVLVDIGASGGAPPIWKPIARYSTYVGFDPDLRDMRRDTGLGYRSAIIVNKAVCPDPQAAEVTFYLTESPYCSSTLQPNADALSKYSFWKLFHTIREARVPATTLDAVLSAESLAQIDWLKIDAQGADLRLYLSIDPKIRRKMLALDTEPGLLDAYYGEDLFVDAHARIRKEGFWLSYINVMGVPRISAAVMKELAIAMVDGMPKGKASQLRTSPGWCEARYLRTTDSLLEQACTAREFVLSWIFAVMDGQYGHALEIAVAARDAGLDKDLAHYLWEKGVELMQGSGSPPSAPLQTASPVWRRMGRAVRKLLRRA
jgi:FkbM family methyltransferase